MLSPDHIVCFYDSVLHKEEINHAVSQTQIQIAIQNMTKAYKPDKSSWNRQEVDTIANYNDPAHRCAYLHKYAPLHTCLVQDMFYKALTECYVLENNIFSKYERFNICSLGGGPGTDIIGIISACQPFGLLPCSAQVVDLMPGWNSTFNSLVEEIQFGCYGNLSLNFNSEHFNYSYKAANLLHAMDQKVCKSIASADLITMVKFVSAATCKDTEGMVKTIFNSMKSGALVLFIDNAAGGFSQMISRSAQECGLVSIYGPLNHFQYTKPEFCVIRYGYVSCFETKVTVQVFIKLSQLRFTYPTQNLSNLSHPAIPKMPTNTDSETFHNGFNSRLAPNSYVSKLSNSSTRLVLPSSETTPFYKNHVAAIPNKDSTQTSSTNRSYGTITVLNSKIKQEAFHISSGASIQSNKRELFEKSDQSAGTSLAEGSDHLPSAKHFKSQKLCTNLNSSSKINEDSYSRDSLKIKSVIQQPVSQVAPSKDSKRSITKNIGVIAPSVNDNRHHLPVLHASPSKAASKSVRKKVVSVIPNETCTRKPLSHSSLSKTLNKSVLKKVAPIAPNVRDNRTREPILHVSPSKALSSSEPKQGSVPNSMISSNVTKEKRSNIVTQPTLVSQKTSVLKKVAPIAPNVRDNRTREPILHVSPSKALSSSVPKQGSVPNSMIASNVTKERRSNIVTQPTLVSQETSSSTAGHDHSLDQNQTNFQLFIQSILKCFCMHECCGL